MENLSLVIDLQVWTHTHKWCTNVIIPNYIASISMHGPDQTHIKNAIIEEYRTHREQKPYLTNTISQQIVLTKIYSHSKVLAIVYSSIGN